MKKEKSNKRKLLSAIASLLVSAAMLSTSTYAWFTMNKEVEVKNMSIKTSGSSNLLISKDNKSDATFVTKLTDEYFVLLEPTSTVDGVNYYYTLDGAADGHKINGPDADNPYAEYNENTNLTAEDIYAEKTKYDVDFNDQYGITTANPDTADKYQTAYGYYDYSFYLKATSTKANSNLVMNECNLLYNGEALEEKAWRIAMLAQEVNGNTETDTVGTLKTIIGLSDAEYQTDNKAVNSITTVDDVESYGNDAIIDILGANETKYYKIVIRIWIEGEDTDCTTEIFGTKTEEYNLDLKFSIADDATPVAAIGSEV